jgi:hypothetical protein
MRCVGLGDEQVAHRSVTVGDVIAFGFHDLEQVDTGGEELGFGAAVLLEQLHPATGAERGDVVSGWEPQSHRHGNKCTPNKRSGANDLSNIDEQISPYL